MVANSLMQTGQSLIRGSVRGSLAQRQVTVRPEVTWPSHVDACARVLSVSAQRTRFWFHHSVRVTLYAAHRARQRVLLGTLSSPRRLTTRVLRHTEMLELALRSALAHAAKVARANISHQQLAYQKFRTWAAMVAHKLGDTDTWLTAAMCDTLQLARVSQHRSMKQWRQESLEEVRACMSQWLMEYQAWVEEIAERWSIVKEQIKRPASAVALSPCRRFKRYKTHHSDPPDYM